MARQPTLYLPHGGGPCFFMEWTMGPADTWEATAAWLRGISASLPAEPSGLLVVSAHWEQPVPTVLASTAPPLLFDYSGFPPHTYELTWPAPGAPELAHRVRGLLEGAGFASAEDGRRGFDHGTFVPLKVAWPQPTIPTTQLSLVRGLDPAAHLRIGEALAPLRDEGVLIIGSGMSYHAMRGFMTARGNADARVFDAWLTDACADPAQRDEALINWSAAPSGRASHPREEHLLPLHVCAGAARGETGRRVFTDEVMGVQVSAIQFG